MREIKLVSIRYEFTLLYEWFVQNQKVLAHQIVGDSDE